MAVRTHIYVFVEIQRTKKYGTKFAMIMMRICAYACAIIMEASQNVSSSEIETHINSSA